MRTSSIDPTQRWRRRRPPAVDVAISTVFVLNVALAYAFAERVHGPIEVYGPLEGLHGANFLVVGVGMAALAWRRQFPLTVAGIVLAAVIYSLYFGELGQGYINPAFTVPLIAFTIGRECAGRRSDGGLIMMAALTTIALFAHDDSSFVYFIVMLALAFIVGPWALGVAFRSKAEGTESALARAAELESEQERQAALAASAERARIARELHDIVSHSISVVTIQTQAVRRRLGPGNEQEAADLKAVEATARDALAEMRRLFGVLRADESTASLAPQPGLGELGRLVDQSRRAGGVHIRFVVEGDAPALSPGLDLAAFRIAQEGLTNALRHSGASTIDLTVRHLSGAVSIEIEDDGEGMTTSITGGHGLVGIRERASLYDGTVEVGRAGSGGVRLSVRLPLKEDQ